MPACGSERIVVGRTLAEIVVHAPDPAVSIGFLEGAGTTLTPEILTEGIFSGDLHRLPWPKSPSRR